MPKNKKIKGVKKMPEKIPKRYFKVYDPIFHRRIHVLLNHSPEEYAKWLTRVGAKDLGDKEMADFSGFSTTMTSEDKPTEFIIFVKNFNWNLVDQNTLIHEIVHTVIKIWDSNNIPHTFDTQEFLAHSIGNMYEDIGRKLLVKTKKR